MAHDQNDSPQSRPAEPGDGQLRSLISLFNWLVGEVVTARIMVLRLAADLVRLGVLPVEEINGMPLTQEIIDSVMSNFPTDPVWQPLGQRLRSSLEALRQMDLYGEEDDEEDLGEDMEAVVDEDEVEMEAELAGVDARADAQVIYRNPDQDLPVNDTLLARISRVPARRQN